MLKIVALAALQPKLLVQFTETVRAPGVFHVTVTELLEEVPPAVITPPGEIVHE